MENSETRLWSVKKMVLNAAAVFLIVMVLLTFFSKTINNYLLPEVECRNPLSGYLSYKVEASGKVHASSTRKIIARGEWFIKDIVVKEGETVAKGSPLAIVDTTHSDLEIRKAELELLKLKNDRQNYTETFIPIDLAAYEKEVARAQALVQAEKENLSIVLALFDDNVKRTLAEAEQRMIEAVTAYEDAQELLRKKTREAAEKKDEYERTVKEKELAIQVQQLHIGYFQDDSEILSIEAFNKQLQPMLLELKRLENDLIKYKNDYEEIDITHYEEAADDALLDALYYFREFEQMSKSYSENSEISLRLKEANRKYEAAVNDYTDKLTMLEHKNAEALAEKNTFNRTVREKDTEIELKSLEIENKKSLIPLDGQIIAPVDCMIKDISIEAGQTSADQQAIIEYIANDSKLMVKWMMNPAQAEIIDKGDLVEFRIKGQAYPVRKGKVDNKEYSSNDGMYLYTSEIPPDGDQLQEGMGIEVHATRTEGQYPFIIPKSALSKQDNRDCVFLLKQRAGALGEEYYVEAVNVSITKTDDLNAAITGDIKPEDKVVTLSTKALSNGLQVKLR